ncbi:translation initiation factor IF-2 [Brevundimonas sp.]|jgi:hypothetical protein|uniref:translation initiation factor IF-2 n=1 Tax=Brevundimonas sp. TaxID=1871086 RepID=UPI003783F5A5
MSARILAAVAVLALAGPAFAQTTPAPTAPAAPAVAAPTEADLEAAGEAFGTDMQAMSAELSAAKTAAGTDTAKANVDADAIVAKYQPKADAFATLIEAFMATQPIPPEDQTQIAAGMARIRNVPTEVREGVMAAPAATPTPAPAN